MNRNFWILYTTDEEWASHQYHGIWHAPTPAEAVAKAGLPAKATHAWAVPVGSGVRFERGGWEETTNDQG